LDVATKGLRNASLPLGEDKTTLDPDEDLKESKTWSKLSPRLGVGFPVSDRMQFHGNYGVFYQLPNLENLYVDYTYVEHKVATGGYYYPFGNPNLRPETTTAYELGSPIRSGTTPGSTSARSTRTCRTWCRWERPGRATSLRDLREYGLRHVKGLDFPSTCGERPT
jgi:outer membrane receptor protein involved in Fe transport